MAFKSENVKCSAKPLIIHSPQYPLVTSTSLPSDQILKEVFKDIFQSEGPTVNRRTCPKLTGLQACRKFGGKKVFDVKSFLH